MLSCFDVLRPSTSSCLLWALPLILVLVACMSCPATAQDRPPQPEPAVEQSLQPSDEYSVALEAPHSTAQTQMAARDGTGEPVLQIQGLDKFSARDGGNDYKLRVDYKVTSPCVFPESISISITSDGGRSYSKSWTSSGREGWVEWSVGPSVSDRFYMTFKYKGGLGCDNSAKANNRGHTDALKAPGTLSASANGSDQNVRLTWSRGSTNTPASSDTYYIYRDGTYVGWTRDEAYTVTTLPATTNTWAIERRWGSKASSRRSAAATTAAFKPVTGLAPSQGTAVRKVDLAWTNPSHYARQTRIYRDGQLLATTAATTTTFSDDRIVPGQRYRYCLTNINSTAATDSTCAGGESFFVRADDGSDVRNTTIAWTPPSDLPASHKPASIRIERGAIVLPAPGSSSASYIDRDGDPGVIYPYRVTLLDASDQVILSDVDHGFLPANGTVKGFVTTEGAQGGGVASVRVSAVPAEEPAGYALALDGTDDYVRVPHRLTLDFDQSYTIEAWVRPDAPAAAQTILAKGARYQLALDAEGRAVFRAGDAEATSNAPLASSTWHHVAAVVDEELAEARLYVDGERVGSAAVSDPPAEGLPGDLTLGAAADGTQPFAGRLDEVRLWTTARTDSAIAADRDRVLAGGEAHLAAYWPFRAGSGTVADDYAHDGGHTGALIDEPAWTESAADVEAYALTSSDGQGAYEIQGLSYDFSQDGTLYRITPAKENHAFDPAFRNRRLTSSEAVLADVNFTDTTSVSVGGVVRFAGTTCPIDSVEIRVNDIPLGLTGEDGAFTIGGLERKEQTFQPVYRNHTFEPVSITRTLNGDVDDLLFENTTTRTLTGYVAGGTCRADIGRARVTVTALNGCFSETIETSDRQYSFTLPAQDYTVEVEMLDDPTIEFLAEEVSLVDSSRALDFIYYAPPRLELAGLENASCGLPILDQGLTYDVIFDVLEDYGDTTCPATVGTLEVFDGIGDDVPSFVHELDSTGYLRYTLTAGVPNIVGGGPNPYQKRLEASVETPGGTEALEQLVYVEGNRPREQTFTTVSPQLPMLILRDPPGDGSYSYKEESRSTCYATSLSLLSDISLGRTSTLKAGTKFGTEILGVSFETHVWGSLSSSVEVGARALGQADREVCLTYSNRYATSGNQDVTGAEGDVFVGAAMNIVYALTDVLDVTEEGGQCLVDLSKSIVYDNDGFATKYHYTESHIRHTVIPDLELNRELATETRRKQEFDDQIEVWYETLELNERLKSAAEPMGDAFNLSYSANAPVEQSTAWTVTEREQIAFNLYLNAEIAKETGVEIGGVGASNTVRVRASLDVGASETSTTTTTNRTGFYLADDDAGDAFSVDVKRDKVYGTPVFDLVSGVSSIPHEPGTLPRDGVELTLSPAVQTVADADGTAEVILSLGNTGQNNEARAYELVFLQETNPDAARVEIAGSPYQGPIPYTLADSEARQVTLRLTRAASSSVYDFDDLQLVLRSPYDGAFADTTSFSVHFDSPCTPITLREPAAGWIVNRAANDSLRIVLTDYAKTNLERIRIETTPAGQTNWTAAQTIPVADLPDGSAILHWTLDDTDDGAFAVRAVAECAIDGQPAVTYSAQAAGTVDREPPRLFGTPGPADALLTTDTFTATFTEPLNCANLPADAVALRHTGSGDAIAATLACSEREVAVTVKGDLTRYENETVQVTLRDLRDAVGNAMAEPASWSFRVNRNPVVWTPARLADVVNQGAEHQFASTLANTGAEAATFALTEFPTWLTPSKTRGTLDPGTEQRLTFDVAPTLAPGTHTGRIIATTPGGAEPLSVTLDVVCEAPAWTVDPAAFAHTMAVTAGLYVDDLAIAEPGDRLAAFVGEDVRGVADVQLVVPQDEYAAFLTAYSNSASGETLAFRFFDASECATRTIAQTIPFEAGEAAGSAVELAPLTIGESVLQAIELLQGWTWISFGVEAADMSTEAVLRYLQPTEGDVVKGQTGYSQYVAGTGWVGALDTLHSGAAYKLHLADAEPLRFAGEPVPASDRPLPVVPGWNWIGYLPASPMPTNDAFASLASTAGDRLQGQFAFTSYDGSQWQGALGQLLPGEGYLLNAQQGGTLTYPGADGDETVLATKVSARALLDQTAPEWTVDAAAYEHSMTVTAALYLPDGRSVKPDLLLGAFAGDEVRGLATPTYVLGGWVYFLTVYGDAADEPLTFKVYDPQVDLVETLGAELSFAPDAALGAPRDPHALRAAQITANEDDGALPTTYALDANYPNPFNPQTTIRFALPTAGPVRLVVYNTLGQQVATLVDGPLAAGWHEATFEAGSLASGVYLYRIEAGDFTTVRQMVLLK